MSRLVSLAAFAAASAISAGAIAGAPRPLVAARASVEPIGAGPRVALERVIPYGRDFVVSDRCRKKASTRMRLTAGAFRLTVYLNFDGAQLKAGGNDSRTNQTNLILEAVHDYPPLNWKPFGGREKAEKELITELKLLFGDFALEFVTQRPASGDYTMVMIGGIGNKITQDISGTVGISPLDCDNSRANDLAVVFGDRLDSTKELAYVIAHELGHSFGLEHVSDERGIMYPALNGSTCCWADSALHEGSSCGRDKQDAKAVLVENIGVGTGDVIAPLVWLVRPGHGALLPSNFGFEVGAADDLSVHHVELFVDDKKLAELEDAPFIVPVTGLSDGEHVLKAIAFDWNPNQTVAELTVVVDKSCPATGSCYYGTAGVGDSCGAGAECSSLVCASKGAQARCASACAGEGASCPVGSTCQQGSGGWACAEGTGWSMDFGSGGGCAVAGPADGAPELPAWPIVLLLAVGYLSISTSMRMRRRPSS